MKRPCSSPDVQGLFLFHFWPCKAYFFSIFPSSFSLFRKGIREKIPHSFPLFLHRIVSFLPLSPSFFIFKGGKGDRLFPVYFLLFIPSSSLFFFFIGKRKMGKWKWNGKGERIEKIAFFTLNKFCKNICCHDKSTPLSVRQSALSIDIPNLIQQ